MTLPKSHQQHHQQSPSCQIYRQCHRHQASAQSCAQSSSNNCSYTETEDYRRSSLGSHARVTWPDNSQTRSSLPNMPRPVPTFRPTLRAEVGGG